MLKSLIIILLSSILLLGATPSKKVSSVVPVATCYGRTPCAACSDCSACKHCGAGGSCGICALKKTTTRSTIRTIKPNTNPTKAEVGQCKALTKKGARCKRSGGSRGYCWQHAG